VAAAYPNVAVCGAKDGISAIARARARKPDVILMDAILPRLNGIEATSKIRAFLPDAVVVILSLYDDAPFRARAKQAGATAYFATVQPFDDVLAVLSRYLSGRAPSDRLARWAK
jgi:DNA-binding NarL/FixJ family response regulator